MCCGCCVRVFFMCIWRLERVSTCLSYLCLPVGVFVAMCLAACIAVVFTLKYGYRYLVFSSIHASVFLPGCR